MQQDYSNLSTESIREMLASQITFDGRCMPDYTESYKVAQLINELLRRSELLDNTTVCNCPH